MRAILKSLIVSPAGLLALIVALAASLLSGHAFAVDIPPLGVIPAAVAEANPSLVTQRDALQIERNELRTRTQSHNSVCSEVSESDPTYAGCTQELQSLTKDVERHVEASNRFNAALAMAIKAASDTPRTYKPSGNGLVGGTGWIVGYNVQNADPKLVARERQMMAQQMKLAGAHYNEGVDFDRYNFVLGIAASTDVFTDLGRRVVFDQFKKGQFSVENQKAYDSMKDRSFKELACHSNGAMVCLAALENNDVVADHVVLYGPQITIESLRMWDELVRSGRVKSVQLNINQGDPVPPVTILTGGGAATALLSSTVAMFSPPSLSRVIEETAPKLLVRTKTCGDGGLTLDCHYMTAYKANENHKTHSSGEVVPGTHSAFPDGHSYTEPPVPQ